MKKVIKLLAVMIIAGTLSSCATIFGGPVSAYQRTKPAPGQQQRSVRVGALICDIVLFWPGAIVDFATGAIYRPQGSPFSGSARPLVPYRK